MATMDDGVDITAQQYLDDYDGDEVQAAIAFCKDALGSVAARNDKFKRREVIELAADDFKLGHYQLAIVQEHV